MRRAVLAGTIVVVAGVGAATAQAKQVVPLHSADIAQGITGSFRSVVINDDEGAVTVAPGRTASLRAQEDWNFHQPTLSTSIRRDVLTITLNCADYQSVGGVVSADPVDLVNDCIDDLSVTLPAATPIEVTDFTGAITTTGMRGGQRLHTDSGDLKITRGAGAVVQAI